MKIFAVTAEKDFAQMVQLRWDVFVVEQEVPFILEIDALDFDVNTTHIVAVDEHGKVVGTARILPDLDECAKVIPGRVHLGRLAVTKELRGKGLGADLVRKVEEISFEKYAANHDGVLQVEVVLLGQIQAEPFYHRMGYTSKPEIIMDAGIEHREMSKVVTA